MATPSFYHGCSTVDSEDGWTKFGIKTITIKKEYEVITILVVAANLDMIKKSNNGSSTFQYKNNSFGILVNHTGDNLDSKSTKDYEYDLPD